MQNFIYVDDNHDRLTTYTPIKGFTSVDLTHSVITKLNKEETVHLDVLLKICKLLDCDIKDIVEIRKSITED